MDGMDQNCISIFNPFSICFSGLFIHPFTRLILSASSVALKFTWRVLFPLISRWFLREGNITLTITKLSNGNGLIATLCQSVCGSRKLSEAYWPPWVVHHLYCSVSIMNLQYTMISCLEGKIDETLPLWKSTEHSQPLFLTFSMIYCLVYLKIEHSF